jgi:predicted P-loop ATPase
MSHNNVASLKVGGSNTPAAQIGHNKQNQPVTIDPKSFPDQSPSQYGVPCTIDNVRFMLAENGISVRYNTIKKKTQIDVPWVNGTIENSDGVSMTHIQSLASRYGMPTGLVPAMTQAIGDEHAFNPAKDWIESEPWDGQDRLQAICDTIVPRDDYPLDLRDLLMRKWLLSVAAAAIMPNFRCRGVLTLQGSQGIGKTAWGQRLINDNRLKHQLIKLDHHLDAGNKDSLLGAIDHWIVEVGELDSSFRRDVARLKGFLSSPSDKIRRPYGHVAVEYPRRTVFYATVNAEDFLVDDSGNLRFWTIACDRIDHEHDIDMQQVFAQCAVLLKQDERWWLSPAEEHRLEVQNSRHRSISVVRDKLMAVVDWENPDTADCPALTPSELLGLAGFEHPSNTQAKECASQLRAWFGPSRRINGRDKWRVPLRPGKAAHDFQQADLDSDVPKKSKFD